MQRYAFFPNCNKNMQNINHFLIFSNTYNPKHTPPPPPKKKESPHKNPPTKKSECSELLRVLRVLPKIPTKKSPHQKRQKKIATRQAGSNHHIKQLLSLNQKIWDYSWNLKFLTNAPISPSLIIASTSAFFNLPTYLKSFSSPALPALTNSTTAGISALSSSSIGSQ